MAKRSAETVAASKEAKHLRNNSDESKNLLDAIPLVYWRMRVQHDPLGLSKQRLLDHLQAYQTRSRWHGRHSCKPRIRP